MSNTIKKEINEELTIYEFDELSSTEAMAYRYDKKKKRYVLVKNDIKKQTIKTRLAGV